MTWQGHDWLVFAWIARHPDITLICFTQDPPSRRGTRSGPATSRSAGSTTAGSTAPTAGSRRAGNAKCATNARTTSNTLAAGSSGASPSQPSEPSRTRRPRPSEPCQPGGGTGQRRHRANIDAQCTARGGGCALDEPADHAAASRPAAAVAEPADGERGGERHGCKWQHGRECCQPRSHCLASTTWAEFAAPGREPSGKLALAGARGGAGGLAGPAGDEERKPLPEHDAVHAGAAAGGEAANDGERVFSDV